MVEAMGVEPMSAASSSLRDTWPSGSSPASVVTLGHRQNLLLSLRSLGGCSSPSLLRAWIMPREGRPVLTEHRVIAMSPGTLHLRCEALAGVVAVVGSLHLGRLKEPTLATPFGVQKQRRNRYAPGKESVERWWGRRGLNPQPLT